MLNINRNLLFKAIILTLCVISFVYVFLFPLYEYDMQAERGPAKTYMDLDFEQSLCMSNITNIKKKRIWRVRCCPQYGIVTIMHGGRLGNQMWEYASVWAVARRTGLEPYIPRCIKIRLDLIFEQLSVPTLEEIDHCPVKINHFVKSVEAWNSTIQSIILPIYNIQPDLLFTLIQDIVQEFTIKKTLLEKSQQILHSAIKSSDKINHIFIGVHVRRTDYIGYIKRKHNIAPADLNFFISAMNTFEQKYNNVIFIIVSDDPLWCRNKFASKANVYISGKRQRNSPEVDMAILASCNHTIYDYGTFGEWGAILAGGETIYYNLNNHSSTRLGQLMKNWHTI